MTGSVGDDAHVLLGGYDLIPPFQRTNPSFNLQGDDDSSIPTDSPYGATPGSEAGEFAPAKVVARIPDATGEAEATDFMKVLRFQAAAPTTPTPKKRFEECAAEFAAASAAVGKVIPLGTPKIIQSPPATLNGKPDVIHEVTGAGRVHVLLHGANFSPDWAYLFGHQGDDRDYPRALSARQLDLCDLRGAVVTFSSCYAAMLDTAASEAGSRTEANQVALACLGHGAKFVVAATRSNWIALDGGGLGSGFIAEVWRQLGSGMPAGQAMRAARQAFLRGALPAAGRSERPYILKTVLQMQLYGNPEAKL